MCLCVCITFWYKKMFLIMKILMCCKAKQDCAAEKALVILLIWCMRDACLSIDWFNADCSASSMSHLRQRQIYIFYGRLFLREIRYMHDCTWMWWAQADKWKQGTSEPPLNRQRSIVIGNHALLDALKCRLNFQSLMTVWLSPFIHFVFSLGLSGHLFFC